MDLIYHHRVHLDHSAPSWDEHPEWFITICCSKRGDNHLCRPEISRLLLESVRFYHRKNHWFTELFLLMPDHIHALISVSHRRRLDQIVLLWKRWTARHLKIKWQTGFFEHRLRSYESANEKYRYILKNPVRAGFVSRPEVWPHKFIGTRFDQFA